jgi:Tfp pilus assembly protein PilE
LFEIAIVVSIIGILAAVIPMPRQVTVRSRISILSSDLLTHRRASHRYATEKGAYPQPISGRAVFPGKWMAPLGTAWIFPSPVGGV